MFFIHRHEKQQRYGSIASSDSDDSETEKPSSNDPHAAFIKTLRKIQAQQQQTAVNTWTCWCIRAAPILATASWTVTLILLLLMWIFGDGMKGYNPSSAAVPFVSEVIVHHTSITLFGTVATAVFLIQSLEQERFLRFKRVLPEAKEERWLWVTVGLLDCLLGFCGSVALFLLPIFNEREYPDLFKTFRATFFICIALSGLLNTAEVDHLWHEHPDRNDLRAGAFLKYNFLWLFISCGVTSRILYGFCHSALIDVDCEQCYRVTTASAILEWVSCFSLSGWFSSLALDVWPLARHTVIHPRFSASSQGLSHVHHEHTDGEDEIEIPDEFLIRRLPMMTRPRVVGYGNGWTDKRDGEEEEQENDSAEFEFGKRRGNSAARKRKRKYRSGSPSSSD
ncbi:uncharacterized protein JCM6883_006075 [Sporobolomyces salmoneus]|uniref:uncharacterized protein n=1 Tax=Sporobolomyces salmoneus TaxID=183962 RepID=UPI00316D0FA6